ncbi:MAG: ATP phosphoribosyltransferase [Gemmatimonadales bacterium]
MIRIAIPNKGRLAEQTRELFEDAGLELRVTSDRALIATVGDDLEAIFVRSQDIPEFVADGAADCGVTGWDLVLESERPLVDRLDLGFGRCRLVLAARDDSPIATVADVAPGTRIATVFPRVTRRFFEQRGCAVEIVPVSGATEIAPHLGIADVIVDLVSTGSTLRVNGLREVATVLDSSARVIAPREPNPARAIALESLLARVESVVRARGQRYVMANVPRTVLDQVKRVVPGLDGPTVVDILNEGGHVAVHAVVAAARIDATILGLKRLGATGILVTRIERLLP